ncbi:MAG: hypothetical protein ABSD70_09755 [Terracidiphilus sp.]|jgi:hypothetical protein
MTTDAKAGAIKTGRAPIHSGSSAGRPRIRQFPGLVAISLYMVLLAAVICFDVVAGRQSALYLAFSVFFIAGAFGLIFLLRWGWALTLAAVAMMSGFFLWTAFTQHGEAPLVQGLLNLVCFLYLVRTDLRDKLR